MQSSRFVSVTAVALAAAVCVPASAQPPGADLHAGDVVVCEGREAATPHLALYRADPATFVLELISFDGWLVDPQRIAVDRTGTVWVADRVSGVVAVEAATGAQTLVAPAFAFAPATVSGVCADPQGGAFCAIAGGGVAAVVHVGGPVPAPRVVSAGGELAAPSCIARGPDGALYVGDLALHPVGISNEWPWGARGGIVRVDAGGGQTLVASGPPFLSPFDIAFAPDGWIVTAQSGALSRRQGGFRRTRLPDGLTENFEGDRSLALAGDGDALYLGDCISVSLDCYPGYRFVTAWSGGEAHYMPVTALAVVPDLETPARRASWGALKSTYR
jgi:sugar lactone lactonase YvrE